MGIKQQIKWNRLFLALLGTVFSSALARADRQPESDLAARIKRIQAAYPEKQSARLAGLSSAKPVLLQEGWDNDSNTPTWENAGWSNGNGVWDNTATAGWSNGNGVWQNGGEDSGWSNGNGVWNNTGDDAGWSNGNGVWNNTATGGWANGNGVWQNGNG